MLSLVTKANNIVCLSRPILGCLSSRLLSTADNEYYDVVISGGGLVGGAMACALGSSPYFEDKKVLLLEAGSPPDTKPFEPSQPYSNRVCAISQGSKNLLERLKVWGNIERKCPVRKMQVWDACSSSLITFDKEDMTQDLCYIIENNLMQSSFQDRISGLESDSFHTKYDTKIKSCTLPRNYAREDVNEPLPKAKIVLDDDNVLECDLLIAADGAKSLIAQQSYIPKISWNYDQFAIVATLKLSESTENFVAWQRFLPTGPIALLPLDDEHSSLVWSTTPEHVEQLMEMEKDKFVAEINEAYWREYKKHEAVTHAESWFRSALHNLVGDSGGNESLQLPPDIMAIEGERAKFPLGMSHANKYVKPRLVLIGDAAHRVHPLAGQGANLGFGDVSCLLSVLEKAVYDGEDVGNLPHLLEYESERQKHNAAVMATVDGLSKLYSTDFMPVVLLRSLGLMGTNSIRSIKDQIISQAMR